MLSEDHQQDVIALQNIRRSKRMKEAYCPECGYQLVVMPLNTTKSNRVGGAFQTLIQCRNAENCDFEIYSERDIKTVIDKLKGRKLYVKIENPT